MNNLRIHACNLFFHFGDFFLPWTNVSFEFFNFVIQNKLELFKFLSFLFQLIDSHHFVSDGFFSFFNLFGLGDFFLKVFFVFLFDFLDIFQSVF